MLIFISEKREIFPIHFILCDTGGRISIFILTVQIKTYLLTSQKIFGVGAFFKRSCSRTDIVLPYFVILFIPLLRFLIPGY